MAPRYAVCADVGSTWTKVAVVDLDAGTLVAAAARPTTAGDDVLRGLDAAVAAAAAALPDAGGRARNPALGPGGALDAAVPGALGPGALALGGRRGAAGAGAVAEGWPWYVCSSAGGGLRLAVVGYEELVTAQAGHRVGLSAGARVVHVAAGRLDGPGLAALRATRPDVVLLVGGTDGGDGEVLVHNATRLARARWRVPVVVAGNADVRERVGESLAGRGVPVTVTDNVLPRIGVLRPAPARAAIREVFLRHVIGGKGLSRGGRFAALVRAATPDAVLTGVELLAEHTGGDLVVVDVGGATTDVYSALTPDERDSGPGRAAAGTLWRARTVEGDLGMRVGAPGVVRAAEAERLLAPDERESLAAAADVRAERPDLLAVRPAQWAVERRIAQLAATVALRRHARGDAVGARAGRDLRDVRLMIGSGGVLRHAPGGDGLAVLAAVLADHAGGWPLPRAARAVLDVDYVLAAGGLLAGEHPAAAVALLRRHLVGGAAVPGRGLAGRDTPD